jgi:hypothetical protein
VNERTTAIATTLLLATACQTDDGEDGFRITNVEFDGDSTLTLTFSEPVGAVDGVDPNDFRLNFAMSQRTSYTYEGMTSTYVYTSYNDLNYIVDPDYYAPDVQFSFMDVAPGSAANQIVLRSTDPITPACDLLNEISADFEMYSEQYGGLEFDIAMFLHYAGGEIPVESESGSPLGDIGPNWVLNDEWYVAREAFGFSQLAPQLRIPCG